MRAKTLKLATLAFILVGAVACKNNEKEIEKELVAASEASELATEYTVDKDESIITWEGSKPTATHHGTMKLDSGVLLVNEGQIEAGKFLIDMKSITDEDLEGEYKDNLEAHLKGTAEGKEGDFFNVNEYPTSTFEWTGYENDIIKGNLTIKDKTNPIEFAAKVSVDDTQITIHSEPIKLDRTKWGVNFGSKSVFDNLGDKFINDIMVIKVDLVAKKM